MIKMIIVILLFLSCNVLADFVIKDGKLEFVKVKVIPPFEKYTKACEHGDMNGCMHLGVLYFTGDSVKEDHTKAMELFNKACKRKNSKACYHLGTIYKRGSAYRDGSNGVVKDLKKAKFFYAKGCTHGNSKSCEQYNLVRAKSNNKEADTAEWMYIYNTTGF